MGRVDSSTEWRPCPFDCIAICIEMVSPNPNNNCAEMMTYVLPTYQEVGMMVVKSCMKWF